MDVKCADPGDEQAEAFAKWCNNWVSLDVIPEQLKVRQF